MPMSRETWDLGHPYDKSGSDVVAEHPYEDVPVPREGLLVLVFHRGARAAGWHVFDFRCRG